MTLLVESAKNKFGYEPFLKNDLPRDFIPWGVLADCVPVFAKRGTPPRAGIQPYTRQTQQLRRGLCEEGLASLVLQKRGVVNAALATVNTGVEAFFQFHLRAGADRAKALAGSLSPALYSDTYWDGRLGPKSAAPGAPEQVVEKALAALRAGTIPQVLNIHATLAFDVLKKVGAVDQAQALDFDHWIKTLRAEALFALRGRKVPVFEGPSTQDGRKPGPQPTTRSGYLPADAPRGGWDVQERIRGVDEWEPDADSAGPFTAQLQRKNLAFVAGPSGTTAGLLTVAKVLGNLSGELLKQYVLACVGFLVSGGHHSYHEVMVVAALAGCPYQPGKFTGALPQSFLGVPEYALWRSQYYDVVMELGI